MKLIIREWYRSCTYKPKIKQPNNNLTVFRQQQRKVSWKYFSMFLTLQLFCHLNYFWFYKFTFVNVHRILIIPKTKFSYSSMWPNYVPFCPLGLFVLTKKGLLLPLLQLVAQQISTLQIAAKYCKSLIEVTQYSIAFTCNKRVLARQVARG